MCQVAKRRRIMIILLILSIPFLRPPPELGYTQRKTNGSTMRIENPMREVDCVNTEETVLSAQQKIYLNHGPIDITSDADFAAQKAVEGWAGNGTQANPYVIEGYNITHNGHNIEVSNVSSYFIIRDCLLLSPGTPPPPGGYDDGVALLNSSHGLIANNTFIGAIDAGIFIGWSHCDAVSNVLLGNHFGISFYNSSGSALYNDIAESVGCCVEIWGSVNCNVSLNTMTSNDAGIEVLIDSTQCTISHNRIDSQNVGISIWGNADSNVIAFNEIEGGEIGILAEEVLHCRFLENTIRHTSEDGITSYGCQYCAFTSNIIIDCAGNGITFYGTDLCLVRYNEIRNNEVGICHESGFDNAFYGNLLHNNNPDAIDHETEFDNVWDDGAGIGNCWTNPELEGPHIIAGWASNIDHFPLLTEDTDLNRPIIASTPDILTQLGESATVVWVAWSGPGTYSLLLDGTELETDYWGGSGGLNYEFEPGTPELSNFTFALYEEAGDTATDTVLVFVPVPSQTAQFVIYSLVGLMIAVVVITEVSRDANVKRFWHRRR